MDWLSNSDFRLLLSDPLIIHIIDSMVRVYLSEGIMPPAATLERLEGEEAKERFREAMLKPSIYRDNEVEQAINEFQDRIHKIKIAESKKRALQEGSIEKLNKIPKLIKERWG